MATRLKPPANDPPITVDGQHSQAWTAHFQQVSDILSGLNVGTSKADDAVAGDIGEFMTQSRLIGSQVALTTNIAVNVATLTLTAGDWDVWGAVVFNPAPTTTCNQISAWLSPGSAAPPGNLGDGSVSLLRVTFLTGAYQVLQAGRVRVSLATTQAYYLSSFAVFAVAGMSVFGTINARRMR